MLFLSSIPVQYALSNGTGDFWVAVVAILAAAVAITLALVFGTPAHKATPAVNPRSDRPPSRPRPSPRPPDPGTCQLLGRASKRGHAVPSLEGHTPLATKATAAQDEPRR